MNEILETLAALSVLLFVIGSMISMGLSLKMAQIAAQLKNVKLVVMALVANFILISHRGCFDYLDFSAG